MPGGRPSKYKKKYCQMLIDHMSNGLSFSSFGCSIDVNRDTLFQWEKDHKEFSDAKSIGREKQEYFYEVTGVQAMRGKIPDFNSTAFVWMTKNMLKWRDRTSLEMSGPDGAPIRSKSELDLKPMLADEKTAAALQTIAEAFTKKDES